MRSYSVKMNHIGSAVSNYFKKTFILHILYLQIVFDMLSLSHAETEKSTYNQELRGIGQWMINQFT